MDPPRNPQPRDSRVPDFSASGGALLEATALALDFGGVHALRDVSFAVEAGEVYSVIGPNGAGKTSLLNCVSGRYRPSQGEILFAGMPLSSRPISARPELGIGRTFQNLALFDHMTVLDNVLVGRHHLLRTGVLRGMIYWAFGGQREELAHRREVEDIIDFLEIEPIRHAVAGTLSYGMRKRVELARAIALKPRLILLDEPMAGMNLEEKEDMARFILDLNAEWNMTVVMIEHDMGVVMDISDRVMVLDFGRKIAEGSPPEILADEHVRRAYLGESDDRLRALAEDDG